MFCGFCGVQLPDGTVRCPNCGNVLVTDQNAAPVAEQQYYANPTADGYAAEPMAQGDDPGKTLGLVSMILGIAGLALGTICSCIASCLGGALPLVLSVVGLILGILGTKKSKEAGFENKKAKIGMILSIVSIAIVVILCVIAIIISFAAGGSGMLEDIFDSMY